MGACLLVGLGSCQEPASQIAHNPKPSPAVDSKAPVTEAEARATFKKIVSNLPSMTGKPVNLAPGQLGESSKPVTREEVLLEFNRIYNGAAPCFKFTPRSVWFDPSLLTVKSGPARKILERLIKEGFIGRVCPLATAQTETMSIDDFAYAVAYFVSRIADLTHLPDTKFTPILQSS